LKFRWPTDAFRGPLLLGLGMAALAAALDFPWFQVPIPSEGQGGFQVRQFEAQSTSVFRLPVAALMLFVPIAWRWRGDATKLLACWATGSFVALCAFPSAVMIGEPELSSQASWLQQQTERLTWLGGDISTSQGNRDRLFKDREIVVDARSSIRVAPIPDWVPHSIQLGRLPEIAEWFGLSNRFSAFVSRGWFFALGGCALVVGSCLVMIGAGWTSLLRRCSLTAAVVGLVLLISGLLRPVKLGIGFSLASQHTAIGDYDQALNELERAANSVPLIRENTAFLAQLGHLFSRAGAGEQAEARLWRAFQLERQGFGTQATAIYRELLSGSAQRSSLRRESSRGMVRAGIRALNATRYVGAAALLEDALSAFPCDVKANLALQLICLRTGDEARLTELVALAYATYEGYNLPGRKIVLAVCQENLCYAALDAHDPDRVLEHRRGMRKP
jgi:hypothetical protein